MNRLLTFAGEQPFYLGDLEFLQDSTKEAFLQLLKGLTGQEKPKCILVKATTEKDGVICFDGEIMPYKPGTSAGIGTPCFRVESAYSGERTFKNGEVHKCYESRYAVTYFDVNGTTSEYRVSNFSDLSTLLFKLLKLEKGVDRYRGDGYHCDINYSSIGDLIHVEGALVVDDAQEIVTLVDGLSVGIPGAAAEAGDRYFTITAENKGVLVSIPAKMELRYESATRCMIDCQISKTSFASGSVGSFAFTITL